MELDEENEHYKTALEPLSSNVAEIEAIVSVLLHVTCEKELPDNLALVVDSRVAFYKVTGWLAHINTHARLTGAAGYCRELIRRIHDRGITVH